MEGPVREAVHRLKYNILRAAAPTLGRLLAEYVLARHLEAELLVPVPLHKRRLRQRGYNQSALLAKELGKEVGLPVAPHLLVRTRDAAPQVSLNRAQRAKNVMGCFQCIGQVKGKAVLLIDDVVTTGSTLSACGASLKQAGARSVRALVLAREA